METEDFSAEIQISATPNSVYRVIANEIDKWWTTSTTQAEKVGDLLVTRFEKTTCWKMQVMRAVPEQKLGWKVVEAHHDVEEISAKDEWKDTSMEWSIRETGAGSALTFVHRGLVPSLKCYKICNAGWSYFLQSLKEYLETGKGHPHVASS